MSDGRNYRCGIVGCGARAEGHGRAYGLVDRGELVACCDLSAERTEKFAEKFDLKGYAEAGEMIKSERLDLVHLVTWPDVRVPLMNLVSDLEVPACIVEKPVACEVKDWKQLCDLEAKTKTKFAVCHQMRWQEDLVRCREALNSGKLGEVLFLDFSSGMNVSGQGTHILDYAMSLNRDGRVVRVFGASSGAEEMRSVHPGPDSTVAEVVFENGVRGLWHCGPTTPRAGDPETTWQHIRISAYAQRGRVLWEEFARWEIVGPDWIDNGRQDMEKWSAGNDGAQAGLINAMFDWVEDDSHPAGTNLELALHQWKAVLALYASSLWRRPVELSSFDPPDDLYDQLAGALEAS